MSDLTPVEFLKPVNCISCGRFVSYRSMEDGTASFYFEPDNHFGAERSEWTCAACTAPAFSVQRMAWREQ